MTLEKQKNKPNRNFKWLLAKNVTDRRLRLGWNQDELAQKAGIARSSVTHVESGHGNPTIEVLLQIAEALQVPLEQLLKNPNPEFQIFKADSQIEQILEQATLTKLLPKDFKGFGAELIEIEPQGHVAKVPYSRGSRKLFYCLKGKISVEAGLNSELIEAGDLLIFSGDQKHSYTNFSNQKAKAISILAMASEN